MREAGLEPDEDAQLRRLHRLRDYGVVATSVESRYDELRDRDRRSEVREPELATPIRTETPLRRAKPPVEAGPPVSST